MVIRVKFIMRCLVSEKIEISYCYSYYNNNNKNMNTNKTENIELSERQQIAFHKYQEGKNLFITGPGGSGKSALIKKIFENAVEREKNIQVTALTGCASLLLGCRAKTLHRWSGIGLGAKSIQFNVDRIMDKKKYSMRGIRDLWRKIDLLVVDEVSMLSLKLFDMLNQIGKAVRGNNRPFGGIQVIFLGDFYQLPPVGDKDEIDTCRFCFESDDWHTVFEKENQIPLTKIFRQTDMTYCNILNQIREGVIKKSTNKILLQYVGRKVAPDSNILPTKLFPTRNKVDMVNHLEMNKLDGNIYEFKVKRVDDYPLTSEFDKDRKKDIDIRDIQTELEYMSNNLPCVSVLPLKVGSQVMCVVNKEMNTISGKVVTLCNGSQGIVVDVSIVMGNPLPVVRFLIQGKYEDIIMVRHDWVSDNIPGVGISQIPLILAWALTIHKCQGATLDIAEIDIGSGIFECGQTYVALSRVRSLDGLYLNSFDPTRIKISRKVKNYYDDLMGFWESYVPATSSSFKDNNNNNNNIPIAVPVLLEEQKEVKIQKSSNPFQSFAYPNNNIPIVTAEPI